MFRPITSSERRSAATILVFTTIVGLAMAAAGRADTLGVHGAIVFLYSLILLFLALSVIFEPEPEASQLSQYYDDPSKVGIVLTMIWSSFGRLMPA